MYFFRPYYFRFQDASGHLLSPRVYTCSIITFAPTVGSPPQRRPLCNTIGSKARRKTTTNRLRPFTLGGGKNRFFATINAIRLLARRRRRRRWTNRVAGYHGGARVPGNRQGSRRLKRPRLFLKQTGKPDLCSVMQIYCFLRILIVIASSTAL